MSLTGHIGAWVAGFSATRAPASARHEAGRCLLDVMGVSIAGSTHPNCALVREFAQNQFGAGRCTVLGSDTSASACAAALVNGTAAHALDLDDVSYDGMVHASAVVWPAAWAAAEMASATGARALEAFIAGVEVHCALGRAFTHDLFWRGFWTTGLLGSMGAAAAAAKAFELDAHATDAAIGIAMAQASGLRAIVGTPMKAVACGMAAELGVRAALMAKAGIRAGADIAGHPQGFTALVNKGVLDITEIGKLGDYFTLAQQPMAFKQYPICSYGQAAVEALLDVLAVLGTAPARVLCEVPQTVLDNMPYGRPADPTQAQFSVTFALGAVLVFGNVAPDHLDADALHDPRLTAAMDRVAVCAANKGAAALALAACQEGAVVTAWDADGRSVSRTVRVPTGMPQRPLGDAQLQNKFLACVESALGRPAAHALCERVLHLEALPDIRQLMGARRARHPEPITEDLQT